MSVTVWLAALAVVLTAYIVLCVYLYFRLFVPRRSSRADRFGLSPWEFQAPYEEISLATADGIGISAWYLHQPGSLQTVVVSGGHKGRKEDMLGIGTGLWRKGFNVLMYNYRGSLNCDRARITMGILEVQELRAALEFARYRVPGARIGLLGWSMGAVVSLLGAASDPSVECLVLDSPFADLRKLLVETIHRRGRLPARPIVGVVGLAFRARSGHSIDEARALAALTCLEPRPLFFIHGASDTVIAPQHSRLLYECYRGPREIWLVPAAGHTEAYYNDRALYVERVAGFFARHLGLHRSSPVRLVEEVG